MSTKCTSFDKWRKIPDAETIVRFTIICFVSLDLHVLDWKRKNKEWNKKWKKLILNYGYVNDACVSAGAWIKNFFRFSHTEGGVGAGLQYPAYFKDAKGNNHSVFGSGNPLHYLKQGPKGLLPDIIQHGRTAGMPLYVRCPICQKVFE